MRKIGLFITMIAFTTSAIIQILVLTHVVDAGTPKLTTMSIPGLIIGITAGVIALLLFIGILESRLWIFLLLLLGFIIFIFGILSLLFISGLGLKAGTGVLLWINVVMIVCAFIGPLLAIFSKK